MEVATCPASPLVAPFWLAVSWIRTLRLTVCPLRPASTVTSPPVLPVGVKTAEVAGPAAMEAIDP